MSYGLENRRLEGSRYTPAPHTCAKQGSVCYICPHSCCAIAFTTLTWMADHSLTAQPMSRIKALAPPIMIASNLPLAG